MPKVDSSLVAILASAWIDESRDILIVIVHQKGREWTFTATLSIESWLYSETSDKTVHTWKTIWDDRHLWADKSLIFGIIAYTELDIRYCIQTEVQYCCRNLSILLLSHIRSTHPFTPVDTSFHPSSACSDRYIERLGWINGAGGIYRPWLLLPICFPFPACSNDLGTITFRLLKHNPFKVARQAQPSDFLNGTNSYSLPNIIHTSVGTS